LYSKSQLAIAHCYRLQSQRPDVRVFWIQASNVDRLEQGFRELAEVADLPGRNDSQVDLFAIVKSYLLKESSRPWLVVLDGLDNEEVMDLSLRGSTRQAKPPLLEYLPQSPLSTVLITTRTMNVAYEMAELNDIIEVGPMTEMESTQLLTTEAQIQHPAIHPAV
jgi:hypothetical protein